MNAIIKFVLIVAGILLSLVLLNSFLSNGATVLGIVLDCVVGAFLIVGLLKLLSK